MSKKSVVIVDDEKNICRLVESALTQNGFEVTSISSGEDTLEMLKSRNVDVVILDVLLPGIDGLETLRQIRANPSWQHIPVIMLTSKNSELDNVIGLELGADDYIGKPIRFHELVARVKSVLRRSKKEHYTKQTMIEFNDLQIDIATRLVNCKGIALPLSYKEFELLTLLARKPGRVFTRDEILNKVWQEEYSLETRTVDVHIRRLRSKLEKLGEENKIIIETVRNVGYRLTNSGDSSR
ncbi:response regulator transcription factor [Desulfosporosinus sp. PR]|uniref:response regulator transcription factor n=1 Tax=Candidatus Desulfosporosinus nitrosoreducens TaxID=3401928 RepID=UPI0027F69235|nr:response regulator transcription factor [Desulfosporosinus sp. PR]MDQ7096767.1 response regulator transcription factor [Desulfosporosinus sp. PR]